MRILVQKPLRFVRKKKCRVHFPTLKKAVLWYNEKNNGGKPMFHTHVIFGRGGQDNCSYPAVGIHGEKILIHVLLMMYRIGGNIPETLVVHHVNEDKTDARAANLELMDRSKHQRHHNYGADCARWRSRKLDTAKSGACDLYMRKGSVVASGSTKDLPF